ncbi:MAG: MerR family transcriptional regulator [Firmicutes bacterium]|nr:MerR family transcriptional regulator [Bacillota bacterium]
MDESTLLSIKEFSAITKVKQSTLRYYDEIGLLPPSARGDNNYRYYNPEQLTTLNLINVLVDLGIPLAAIKKLTEYRSPQSIIELFQQQESRLDYQLSELRRAYSIIHTFRKNILHGLMAPENDVRIEMLPEDNYVLGPKNRFKDDDTFYKGYVKFYSSAAENKNSLKFPICGYYEDMNEFLKNPCLPARFFSLDPFGDSVRPAGKYLVGYNRGHFSELPNISQKMFAYANENGLLFKGPVYVICLLNEISIMDPKQHLAQVLVNVSGNKK